VSVVVRCECGKENRVADELGADEVYCIRCSRAIPFAAAPPPPAADPYGLVTPVEPAAPPRHPAAAAEEADPVPRPHHPREYLYWLLPLALLPLAFALGQPDDDTVARFKKTIDDAPAEVRHRIERLEESPDATLEDLFAALPGHRIRGAFLPRDTAQHWLFAGLAVAGFLGLALGTFTGGKSPPGVLLGVGLFTATAGVVVLMAVQEVVTPTYHDVLEDDGDFLISLCGYVLGVGLFEEAAKALPLLWRFRQFGPPRWRAACLWGLASGAGFGVAEGVFYATRMYNGVATADAYFVRFASCVALHAVWTASVALGMVRHPGPLLDTADKAVYAAGLLRVLAVPMVLHGLYDVLLQYHFNAEALAVALASFGWLAWQIESTRAACAAPAPG
jgi:RsiW-degrading membrane proteinase PrsW (M82 family)